MNWIAVSNLVYVPLELSDLIPHNRVGHFKPVIETGQGCKSAESMIVVVGPKCRIHFIDKDKSAYFNAA